MEDVLFESGRSPTKAKRTNGCRETILHISAVHEATAVQIRVGALLCAHVCLYVIFDRRENILTISPGSLVLALRQLAC